MAETVDPEIEYYRSVEDLFAALRGVPHILSPKDFQLLRTWWRDEVPLSAVRTGITEVFARRRESEEDSPVVSLSYCKHAVKTHARRMAEMQVGAPSDGPAPPDPTASLHLLAEKLADASEKQLSTRPRVATAIDSIRKQVLDATDLPPHLVDEHLYSLESALLANCLSALDETEKERLEEDARGQSESAATEPDARERTFRALRDRTLRALLALPRLEIDA